MKLLGLVVALVLILAPTASAAPGGTAYALSDGQLLRFDPRTPQTVVRAPITGVDPSERLVGIDVRPVNGKLYGLGVDAANDDATLYLIGPAGQATAVGLVGAIQWEAGGTDVDLPDARYGFDVNPQADRIRVTAENGLNARIDPNTGTAVDGIPATAGVVDPDTATSSVDGAAYTNSRIAAASTTLYALSAATDRLTVQNPPNDGTQTDPKPLGLDTSAVGGFDIAPSGEALAALTVAGTTKLHAIDLGTGAATAVGPIGDGTAAVQGLALTGRADDGLPVVGLTAAGTSLVRFTTSVPASATTVAINGATLDSLAWRPATGQLYGLDAAGATLHRIDPQTGRATAIGGPIAYDGIAIPNGADIDFNPTVDRIRIVGPGSFNARANPITGMAVDGDSQLPGTQPDGAHNGAATTVTGATYTNAFAQPLAPPGPTRQYVVDAAADRLLVQDPPNTGALGQPVQLTVDGTALDVGATGDLDVGVLETGAEPGNSAWAAFTVGGTPGVYALDLGTGAARLAGTPPATLKAIAVGDAAADRVLPPAADPGGAAPTVVPAPAPVPTISPSAPDRTAPRVSGVKVGARKGRRVGVSTRVSEPGTLTVRFLREQAGRRKGRRCVAGRRKGRRCVKRSAYGTVTKRVTRPNQTIRFTVTRRVAFKNFVPGGKVRVELRARDIAGNRSKLVVKTVRVKR